MIGRGATTVHRVDDEQVLLSEHDLLADEFYDEPHAAPPHHSHRRARRESRLAPWVLLIVIALGGALAVFGLGMRALVLRSGIAGTPPPGPLPRVYAGAAASTPRPVRMRGSAAARNHRQADAARPAAVQGGRPDGARARTGAGPGAGGGAVVYPTGRSGGGQSSAPDEPGRAVGGRAAAVAAAEFGFER